MQETDRAPLGRSWEEKEQHSKHYSVLEADVEKTVDREPQEDWRHHRIITKSEL